MSIKSPPFRPLRIATRQSPLALAQAEWVRRALASAWAIEDAETAFPLVPLISTGDVRQDDSLAAIGGKGLFAKEIEHALLDETAEIAVHSLKDLPAHMPPGLIAAAWPAREDPRDAFLSHDGRAFSEMRAGEVIGTSSIRRRALVARLRPDLKIVPYRGNVQTRLANLKDGKVQGTFLAEAGLRRLGLSEPRQVMSPRDMLPAPGQGTLCVQVRASDAEAQKACAVLRCPETETRTAAERALLQALDASCRTPLGAYAEITPAGLSLTAEMTTPDGARRVTASATRKGAFADGSQVAEAAALGDEIANRLKRAAGPDLPLFLGA